jgi:hypothetical protein
MPLDFATMKRFGFAIGKIADDAKTSARVAGDLQDTTNYRVQPVTQCCRFKTYDRIEL